MEKLKFNNISLGLYEKALPDNMGWEERLSLAHKAGYDFMEISIDESDDRIERLKWDKTKMRKLREAADITGIPLLTMCLSANRRFPIGSGYPEIQKKGMEILGSAIQFASSAGIRIVQIAGYDVLMNEEVSTVKSKETFAVNLEKNVALAASLGIMLAIENVDIDFGNSIDKLMYFIGEIKSPWLQIYPDIGNLTAMRQNVAEQLLSGKTHIAAIHAKDTHDGVVRRVPFGEGIVDFVSAFKTLKNICFSGPVLLEMWADDSKDNFEIVKNSKKWIHEKLEQAGYF